MTAMIAVVVTRGGALPLGGDEVVAECDGRAVVVDVDGLTPAALAADLADRVRDVEVIVLPASADGRDLAPRLAAVLNRPLLAGAIQVAPGRVRLARRGGSIIEDHEVAVPFVATLEPGVRGVPDDLEVPEPEPWTPPAAASTDPVVGAVTAPDAAHLDLAEARCILAVGAGLADARYVELATSIAGHLGMSLGATRVVTDWGWLPFERQIGTTGVMVDPDVYVAVAISGAVQHVTGLGEPDSIISVNTDGSCPMAAMADLNLVADGRAVLVALADRLDIAVDPELRSVLVGAGETADAGDTADV